MNNNTATLVPSPQSRPDTGGNDEAVCRIRQTRLTYVLRERITHCFSRTGDVYTANTEAGLKNSAKTWAVEKPNLLGHITKVSGEFPA